MSGDEDRGSSRLAEAQAEILRLRAEVRRLASIAEHAPDYIIQCDRAGRITYMNRPAPGHAMSDMVGSDVRRWMQPEHHAAFDRAVAAVFETGAPASYESVGSVTGCQYVSRISPVTEGDDVRSAILITHDITELREAEARRRESDARYRALLDAHFGGITVSVDGVIVEANRPFAAMFGVEIEDVLGKSPADLATPESAARALQAIRSGSEAPYELTAVRRDGSTFPCEVLGRNTVYDGRPARITGFRDISVRRRLEGAQERVRHAQKLETLGVLAGGIAHDFNNLLGAILANADVALVDPGAERRVRPALEHIRTAVLRARELTRQLLVYSGRSERRTVAVDLSGLIRETSELLRVSVSKKVRLELDLAPELPLVDADLAQIRQVVMNLLTNASDATGSDGGRVDLRTGAAQVGADTLAECYADATVAPGDFAFFEVRDDGCGMAPDTAGRMFDPFFTTKFAGRGLGLAATLGIVRAHHGAIQVETAPGAGTAVRVFLPVTTAVAVAPPVEPARHESTAPFGAGRTILVAEDEAMLLEVLCDVLAAEGFTVQAAADGGEALERFARSRPTVMLLDVTMPVRDGLAVLEEVRAAAPTLPVVLVSGYTDAPPEELRGDPYTAFVDKPYRMVDLLTALRRLLDGAA